MPRSIGFRCPDGLAEEIEQEELLTGKLKTEIILERMYGLPSVPVSERKSLPEFPAVYLVWSVGKLLYVGKTENLRQHFVDCDRLIEYLNLEARVAWFSVDGCDRLEIDSNGLMLEVDLRKS